MDKRILQLRWEPEKGAHEAGLHHAQVFAAGKWRTMHVACRNPRKFTAKELREMRHTIWVNSGKYGQSEDITFEVI